MVVPSATQRDAAMAMETAASKLENIIRVVWGVKGGRGGKVGKRRGASEGGRLLTASEETRRVKSAPALSSPRRGARLFWNVLERV